MGYTVSIASAGSGKTTSMVGNIIEALLKADERGLEDEINGTMAITFTNKAASEMKQKILDTLRDLSQGTVPAPYRALVDSLGGAAIVAPRAANALLVILHNYHLFHIHTIDSFIQKIARTIAYELELPVNYEITLDKKLVITRACKSLIGKTGTGSRDYRGLDTLFDAYMDYLLSEKFSWKLEEDFTATALELLGEQFYGTISDLESTEGLALDDGFLKNIHAMFFKLKNAILEDAREALAAVDGFLRQHSATEEIFFSKGKGNYTLLKKIAGGTMHIVAKSSARIFSPWFKKADQGGALAAEFDRTCAPLIRDFAESTLVLSDAASASAGRGTEYLSCEIFLRTLPTLCLMKYIDKETASFIRNEGIVLLDEFTKRLKEKIRIADIPYIFVRLDAEARRMFIDEFQDTSSLQWLALEQFKDNLTASGKDFFIIGDPKQAIYRWRNGDVGIMLDEIRSVAQGAIEGGKLAFLDTNYRSLPAVVAWNNLFFSLLCGKIKAESAAAAEGTIGFLGRILESYASHEQKQGTARGREGYVRIEVVTASEEREAADDSDNASADSGEESTDAISDDSQELEASAVPAFALERCLELIKENLDIGYRKKDIAILIRNNKEAEDIASLLLANDIGFVSENSFTVASSAAVRCLILLLGALVDERDSFRLRLAMDLYAHYFAPGFDYGEFIAATRGVLSAEALAQACRDFPWHARFVEFFARSAELRSLTLYNAAETLIGIFGFNTFPEHAIFLQFFLDQVQQFAKNSGESFRDFSVYMDNPDNSLSIALNDTIDAVRIMTIHKSKGLEFPVVILPNTNWKIQEASYIEAEIPRFIWKSPKSAQPLYVYRKNKNILYIPELAPKLAEEGVNSLLDNINLLYVAMTRAMEVLHVIIPIAQKKNIEKYAAGSLSDCATIGGCMLASLGPEACASGPEAGPLALYEKGNHGPAKAEEKKNATEQSYPFITQPGRVFTAANLEDIRIALDSGRTAQVDYGNLVHRYFSRLRSAGDTKLIHTEPAFAVLSEAEKIDLEAKAARIWALYEKAGWLALPRRYFEAGILAPGGEKRPDCVFAGGERAVIVDYKTGTQADTDKPELLAARFARQLGEYADLYRALGYAKIETWIAAPERSELIEVNAGAVS